MTGPKRGIELDLGFTLGLEMPFESTVEWANEEGFEFVELLLDGPYARERIADDVDEMQTALTENGVDIVVHLPFAINPGVPFSPVREGIIAEFEACMDLASDLGARKVVFHPSSDAWNLGWDTEERQAFVHQGLDRLIPAATDRDLEPCLENVVSTYYDAAAFPELLERYPDASMTFDTSHAFLSGMTNSEMATFCEGHADRISHLHLVDTRGGDDEHLHPGMGTIEFDTVLEGLARRGWRGTATLEVGTDDVRTISLGKTHVEAVLDKLDTTPS